MTGYKVYKEYLALKNHFKGRYDYFKYSGKMRVNEASYLARRDRYFFEKLAKHPKPGEFLLANLVDNEDFWVGSISVDHASIDCYLAWKKRQQSLTYTFSTEVAALLESFDENFKVKNNQHPWLLRLFYGGRLSIETLCILVQLSNCMSYWDKKLGDDPIWKPTKLKIEKYTPFVQYDRKTFKKIVLGRYSVV